MEGFTFTERLSVQTTDSFHQFTNDFLWKRNVALHINVQAGGELKYAQKIMDNIQHLKKNGSNINISGRLFVSNYFNIFLLGDARIITPDSVGIIHLPVFTSEYKKKKDDDDRLIQRREDFANFISAHTKLTVKQVYDLNEQRLTAELLMKYGIATKLVNTFEPWIYS